MWRKHEEKVNEYIGTFRYMESKINMFNIAHFYEDSSQVIVFKSQLWGMNQKTQSWISLWKLQYTVNVNYLSSGYTRAWRSKWAVVCWHLNVAMVEKRQLPASMHSFESQSCSFMLHYKYLSINISSACMVHNNMLWTYMLVLSLD